MSNPLYNAMGNGNLPGPLGNVQQIMQRFNQFRQQFHGDPRAQVQQMLQSGQVSQQQYDQAVQMANRLQQMLGGK